MRWGLTPCATIRQGDYKLIEFFGDRVDTEGRYQVGHRLELYNLRADIGETKNLAEQQPALTAELRGRLRDWMASVGAKPSVRNPHHDPDRAFVETREKPDWFEPRE